MKLGLRCAKKVVYHSLGLMDFAIGLVGEFSSYLCNKQVKFVGDFNLQKITIINPDH